MTSENIRQLDEPIVLNAEQVSVYYGEKQVLRDVMLTVPANKITALIGPSGSGKSTLLRCFNRMNDLIRGARVEGRVCYRDQDLYDPEIDPVEVRRRVGMVFQKPNPFPKSIYENVTWAARINGYRGSLDELVESSLRKAALWEEVKDRLKESALSLSGGQQQRLCIARCIAIEPEVILMDEPASALDPIATLKIEELMHELKENYTILIVTHNMQQAARVSDYTAMMMLTEDRNSATVIEFDKTQSIFTHPSDRRTEDYITGRFG